jgi:hypothetical protein
MSILPVDCALSEYEVPTEVPGVVALEGVLIGDVSAICRHCLDIKTWAKQPLCNPKIYKADKSYPEPFLVLVKEPPTSVLDLAFVV